MMKVSTDDDVVVVDDDVDVDDASKVRWRLLLVNNYMYCNYCMYSMLSHDYRVLLLLLLLLEPMQRSFPVPAPTHC